jgi:ParB-like nuclease family protein
MTVKISRHLLPQIPGDKLAEFRSYMENKGIDCEMAMKPVKSLRAIQKHVNREKVEHLKKNLKDAFKNPIIISKGGWILDGHHRWLAVMEVDPEAEILCEIFFCTINELIALGHKFEFSFTQDVKEAGLMVQKQFWNEKKTTYDADWQELVI